MATPTSRGIPLSLINCQYLHANSTSHTWPFSAIAELIDNAYDPDVNAEQLWIDKTVIKGQDCLVFMDNGNGMESDTMHKMLSFGFSDKTTVEGHVPIGRYGNGFKSGSMRLGKDVIVLSKKDKSMCAGLLSQTYLEKIEAQHVLVPVVMFTNTEQTVSAAPEHAASLHDILTHSLFNTKEELLSEFDVISRYCTTSSGTRIIIWNLRRSPSGELEFDFMKDPHDIRIFDEVYSSFREKNKRQSRGAMSVPESEYSLRAYCSILYLNPRMEIILQGQTVKLQDVRKTLAKTRYSTYKPDGCKETIKITFGYNKKSKECYGLMMYHKNRLIKAYELVACQIKNTQRGEGVIGVLECNHLTPTHNKQDFDDTRAYRNTLKNVNTKLEEYWYGYCNSTFVDSDKQNRKQQKKKTQQSHFTPRPSDAISSVNLETSFSTTPKRKNKALDMSQERQKKKAKKKSSNKNITDFSGSSSSDAALESDPQNDTVQYKQAMEAVEQLQDKLRETEHGLKTEKVYTKLDSLEYEKQMFQENPQKCLEKIKNDEEENVKIRKDCAAPSTEASNPGRETDYRFLCSHAGIFHCKLTNLVFEMKREGNVSYTVLFWEACQLHTMGQWKPAGPLYNIKCSQDSVLRVHLPHCEIHIDNQIELVVAHFSEDNLEIIKPLNITSTHVIFKVQSLSNLGLLKKWIFPERPISAQILLFYKEIIRRKRTLYIHLLPGNVPVEEVQKKHFSNKYIQCSSLCQLIPGKKYRPFCEPYEAQPKDETFLCFNDPNYHSTFDVTLNNDVEELTLGLLDENGQQVWKSRQVFLTADSNEAVSVQMDKGAEFVDNHRDILIQRVLTVVEIADTLRTKNMITPEKYNDITSAATPQDKMRILYSSLDSGGRYVKAEFYKILREKQPDIVVDIESRSNNA